MISNVKSIGVVSSTRADYGILKPLLQKLHKTPDFELFIVATGMHLCPEYGLTYREIEEDGLSIHRKIGIQMAGDSSCSMSKTMGMALICFSDYFANYRPDMLIVLGDRYEVAAVCCAAANERIPIAHIAGGEETGGAVDEAYRHSITKMSYLHFTSCEAYRNRVIHLGEDPSRVFNVGALGVENILNESLYSLAELERELDFYLNNGYYTVVTFHPVTLEENTAYSQMAELTAAMDQHPELRYIITKSNSDADGMCINLLWEQYARTRPNCFLTASLGMKRYLSALRHATMMIGNSSSGIIEGPASKIPTINIGDRQRGRIQAASILNCPADRESIIKAMAKAFTPEFQLVAKNITSPFGNGGTSDRIIEVLQDFLFNHKISITKQFYGGS